MSSEIIKYDPGFKDQVLELQKHLWGPDESLNAAYLEWKYERNPYSTGPPLIYLAVDEGEVVGMRGFYGARWQAGRPTEVLDAVTAGDTVISPGHRSRGLFTRIMKWALEDLSELGYTYVFNLSGNPVVRFSSITTGWREVGELGQMSRRVFPRLVIPTLARDYAGALSRLLPSLRRHNFHTLDNKNAGRRRSGVSPRVTVEAAPRPGPMAKLIERTAGVGPIRHVRDEQWFAWRFDNPLSLYRFLFWEGDGGVIEGYMVLQTKLYKNYVNVNIVDLEGSGPGVLTDLLEAAIRLGGFDKMTVWSGTLSSETKELLKTSGFKPVAAKKGFLAGARPGVLVRPVRDDLLDADWVFAGKRLLDLADWDLRMIYSDAF